MGTKPNPCPFWAYGEALDEELIFGLLGRDQQARDVADKWADDHDSAINTPGKTRPRSDEAKLNEASQVANAMRAWRQANPGAWKNGGATSSLTEAEARRAGIVRLQMSWPKSKKQLPAPLSLPTKERLAAPRP